MTEEFEEQFKGGMNKTVSADKQKCISEWFLKHKKKIQKFMQYGFND